MRGGRGNGGEGERGSESRKLEPPPPKNPERSPEESRTYVENGVRYLFTLRKVSGAFPDATAARAGTPSALGGGAPARRPACARGERSRVVLRIGVE